MSTLLPWILAASASLAPARPHDDLAGAIAAVVDSETPLFRDDVDRKKTAALLVAVAFRESSLRAAAVGDHVGKKPTSFCAFQINLPWGRKTSEGWTGEELTQDPLKCATTAFHMLRASMKSCSAHPLAWYAAGPLGCTSPRAQRISRDRLALAARLVKTVNEPVQAPEPDGNATPPSYQGQAPAGSPSSREDERVATTHAAP